MRYQTGGPSNSWPDEMEIRVVDAPADLLELLFFVKAWSLTPSTRVPPLRPGIEPSHLRPIAEPARLAQLSTSWDSAWRSAWARMVRIEDKEHDHISPVEMHAEFGTGPRWGALSELDALSQSHRDEWLESIKPTPIEAFSEQRERLSLPSLVPAWERGLKTVIVMPYYEYFAASIGSSCLAVSAATRQEIASYCRALDSFMPDRPPTS